MEGYYVNNEYETPEMNENPPEVVDIARVVRNILADSPRVTRFDIKWAPDVSMERVSDLEGAAAAAAATAAMGVEPMEAEGGAAPVAMAV
eukprot:COSAG01_NODE_780_length_13660_cov_171.194233_17_plen_90_part_00